MERANIDDGVYLEYMIKGRKETEPVILIHGSVIADANAPLLAQPVLMNHYYMISRLTKLTYYNIGCMR